MDPMPEPPEDRESDDEGAQQPNVGDAVLGKTRLLSRQCATCIFTAGDPLSLGAERLREFINQARRAESYIVCHSTLGILYPDTEPAICRGFADRYSTQTLRLIHRLWGFVEVAPPGETQAGDTIGSGSTHER
ncbi:MAG TPA: hypothetical protein VF755_22140 [Catenuloplanes sp.]|jgi:hypothetical protein